MSAENPVHALLVRLKRGQIEVIHVLYPRYAKDFYWYAVGKGLTHEDAEDVVETVFHKIIVCIQSYDETFCSGEKWLWTICKNQVIDACRRKQRQGLELLETYPCSEEMNPEVYFEKKERIQTLVRALERISEADREELRRGRGRGPGRKAWHEAVQRLRAVLLEEYSL